MKPLTIKNLSYNKNWEKRIDTKFIVLHHAYARNYSFEQCNNYHRSKGWHDIGYHFYIEKDGKVYEGRNVDVKGAHSFSSNDISIGICLEGNFELEHPTAFQRLALVDLLRWLVTEYKDARIMPHSALDDTICPAGLDVAGIMEKVYKDLPKEEKKETEYIDREEFEKYKTEMDSKLKLMSDGYEEKFRRLSNRID